MCIHRLPKKNGARCPDDSVHDTEFCASHRRFSNKSLFYDADVFFGDEHDINVRNVFACFSRLWSKHTDPVRGSFVGVEILSYVMNHDSIDQLATKLGIKCERGQKNTVIMEIVITMRKLWRIQTTPRYLRAITAFQNKWRDATLPDMGPFPKKPAINDEDVFTMEPLVAIEKKLLFSFIDSRGQVFAFRADFLSKHVFVFKNAFNPLTRDPISLADLQRLERWAKIYTNYVDGTNLLLMKTWPSPIMAFTEITSEFERSLGFFTQPMWYTRFDQYDVMKVFHEFHGLAGVGCPFMNREVEEDAFDSGDDNTSQMALAKEMYRMALDSRVENHMYYVCCLFVALASVSIDIKESLPTWIDEIV